MHTGYVIRSNQANESRVTLAVCVAVYAAFFGVMVVTALLPAIQQFYGATAQSGATLLTSSLFGIAVGYLCGGPMSDRYGRRIVLLTALAMYSLLALCSAVAATWTVLQWLRFAQSVAAGAAVIVAAPVFKDMFKDDVKRATRANILVLIAVATGSTTGVLAGALLHAWIDWRLGFVAVALLSAMAATLSFLSVPESLPESARSGAYAASTPRVLSGGSMLLAALVGGVANANSYVFVGAAPLLVINAWGLEPTTFALINLVPTITMVSVALAVRWRLPAVRIKVMAICGSASQTLAGLLLLFAWSAGQATVWTFYLAACLSYAGNAMLSSYSTSSALAKASGHSGAVGTFVGCLHVSCAALGTLVPGLGAGESGAHVPLALIGIGAASGVLCCWMWYADRPAWAGQTAA